MSLMKFVSGSNSEKIKITVLEPTSDKKGYPIIIEDSYRGKNLPPKYARAYLVGSEDNSFFTLSGPIRRMDENNIPITEAKMKDGEYLTEKGEVTNESLAARVNTYIENQQTEQLVYSDLGTINIVNTKGDKTLTKFTLASIKLYSDLEALTIAKKNYKLAQLIESSKINDTPELKTQIESLKSDIKETQRNSGVKQTLFINDKTNFLESLGFEIRKKEKDMEAGHTM